jgi:flagellar protein FliT
MERAAWILQRYEALALLSEQMREAARHGQWDELVELEQKRDPMLSELRTDGGEAIPDAIAARVSELIRSILAADDETSSLASSWRGELQELIASLGTERKLFQAYGP